MDERTIKRHTRQGLEMGLRKVLLSEMVLLFHNDRFSFRSRTLAAYNAWNANTNAYQMDQLAKRMAEEQYALGIGNRPE